MPFVGGHHTRITNPRWRTAAILEKSKNCYYSAAVKLFSRNLARWCSLTLLTVPTVKKLKFQKSKMAATAILKNQKVTYPRSGLSDFYKIWHSDAVRSSWLFRSLKCKILKIQASGCQHLEKSKIEISRQSFDRSPQNLAWCCSSTLLTVPTVKN